MFYDKFSYQPNKSISLASVYGRHIEGQYIKTRIFENNVILPTGYNRDHIKDMLESGILQHNFRVVGSPADGFCLLHSLCLSIKSQFPDSHPLSINELIRILKNEVILHKERYLTAFENDPDAMMHGLSEYIKKRIYDSDFGDIVPQILADALGIHICVLYKDGNLLKHTPVPCYRNVKSCVFVFKVDKHYDAVVPASRNHDVRLMSPKPSWVHNDMGDITMSQDNHQRNPANDALRLIAWNINGLTHCKLLDDILGKFLSKYDIILLCETWTSDQEDIALDGFEFYNFSRPSRHCNAKRNSGGLGVFIRNHIKNHVKFVKKHEDVIVWFKLEKEYFNLPKDIYLGNVYIVPEGSSYLNDDVFHLIKQDIAKFSSDAQVLICGDYNARTGVASDSLVDTVYGNDNGLNEIIPDYCLLDYC